MLGAAFGTLVMGLTRMEVIQLLINLIYVGIVTLLQAVSGFQNSSHESGLDRRDLQTGRLYQLDFIFNFRF